MKEKLKLRKEKFLAWKKSVNEKRDINTEKYRKINIFMMLIFPIFIACIAEINQGKSLAGFFNFFADKPTVMLFNFIFATLIFYVLLLAIGRGWIAMAVHGLAYMTFSTVELFKFGTNGNHLILSEMKLFKSVKSMTSFAYIKITPRLVFYIGLVVVFVAVAFWLHPRVKIKPIKRVSVAVSCALPCVAMIIIPQFAKPVYILFDITVTKSYNAFMVNEKYKENGLLAFLLETATEDYENRLTKPEGYSEGAVMSVFSGAEVTDGAWQSGVKPNVVVIMSESYADFRAFDELGVDDVYYAGFDKACEGQHSGTVISPTYASFTVRTEFELMFGLPVRSLNDVNMPQRELARREQPGIPRYYKSWGYDTYYVHPFYENFYNRKKVYPTFGFDTLLFENDFTVDMEKYGTYVSDETVYRQIEEVLKNADKPVYLHATTMQNHQPYDQGPDPDAEFENYLNWIKKSGDDLLDFLANVKELETPTIVIFIGDHFPSLKNGSGVYESLGLDGANCSKLYVQNYLLWSNYDINCDGKIPEDVRSVFYLPYIIFDIIGAPHDEFINIMMNYMDKLPIYSTCYSPDTPRDEYLDMLTYDRAVGDVYSPYPRS